MFTRGYFLTINCVSQMDPPIVSVAENCWTSDRPFAGRSEEIADVSKLQEAMVCSKNLGIQAAEIPWVFSMVFPLVSL